MLNDNLWDWIYTLSNLKINDRHQVQVVLITQESRILEEYDKTTEKMSTSFETGAPLVDNDTEHKISRLGSRTAKRSL